MKYYLAPMEGLTTYTFRMAYHKHYKDFDTYFTPFLANKNLNSNNRIKQINSQSLEKLKEYVKQNVREKCLANFII